MKRVANSILTVLSITIFAAATMAYAADSNGLNQNGHQIYDHHISTNIQNSITSVSQRATQQNAKQIQGWIDKHHGHQFTTNNKTQSKIQDQLASSNQCLNISGINLRGISLLTEKELTTISSLNPNCYTTNAINRLIQEITQLYINKGYITARVLLSPVDKAHRLTLNVIEGKLESIEITKDVSNKYQPAINTKMLFPDMLGKPLNLRKIEQGLDQANRLQSNHVTVSIKPGKSFGGSILSLHNQASKAWHGNISVDNYGQPTTGYERASLSYSFDSPFGLSDYINFGSTTTLQKDTLGFSRSYNFLYSVPYGNFSFNTFASYSQYGFKQNLNYYSAYLSGNSYQLGLKSDYVFFRNQNNILSFYGEWIKKQSKNYFEHEKLAVSSFNYDDVEIGMNELHKFQSSTLNMNIGIEKGMPELVFNSHKHLNAINSLSDFTKLKTDISFNKIFFIKNNPYQLSNRFYGQYSSQDLPSADSLSLSDPSAIRGIVKNYLNSGSGAYLQTTVTGIYRTSFGTFSPRAGVDFGSTYYHHNKQQQKRNVDSAMGMSVGCNYAYKHLNIDLMANKGFVLNNGSHLQEPFQMLAQVSLSI